MKRPAMLVLGYTFLVLGVLGLFLPILQGFLFLMVGLAILARYTAWARLVRMRLVQRYPKLGAKMDQAERTRRYYLRRLKDWWFSLLAELRQAWWRWRRRAGEARRALAARSEAWLGWMQGICSSASPLLSGRIARGVARSPRRATPRSGRPGGA